MKIPVNAINYQHCKNCNSTDFGFLQKGAQLGIYCSRCGRWLKWANEDERNLYEMHVPAKKGETVTKVLEEIKAEIVERQKDYQEYGWAYDDALEIIDKYREEQTNADSN